MSDHKEKDANWMQNLWRPAMGWMYMLICLLDTAVFPVLWSLLQAYMKMPITQWNPLTLQGAGLFHLAMGAVLGIAAFGRTQEKIAGTAVNPAPAAAPSFGAPAPAFGAPTQTTVTQTFGSTPAPAFGSAPAPAFSSSGKPMPIQPEQPIL
jgi:hypothetical protein